MSMMDLLEEETAEKPVWLSTPQELWQRYEEDQPDVVAIDTESRDTYRWHLPNADPFCFTFSWGRDRTFFLRIGFPEDGDPEGVDEAVAEVVRRIMLSTPTIVYHNAKYDLHVTKKVFDRFGIPLVTRRIDDTLIMSPVLNEHRYHGLNELADGYGITLDDNPGNYWADRVAEWRADQAEHLGREPSYHEVPDRIMVPYASQDAYQTFELFRLYSEEMDRQMAESRRKNGGKDVRDIYELEMQLIWVLFQAEERGMRIDRDFVIQRIAELSPQLEDLKAKCFELVGWDVNPGSTDDIAKILQDLEVDTSVWINPKTGKEKLPEWVLEGVIKTTEDSRVREICTWTLEYRTASKLLSTYFETLRDDAQLDEDGQWIIRCNVKQTGARTGRTSVTDPPLQTLPRKKGNVREAFIAREGHTLIFADYSQQELRVLSHYMEIGVKDRSMSDIIRQPGADLHKETATAIYGIPIEEIADDSPYRQNAKDTNFAIVYGAGAKKMMAILGAKTEEQGKYFLDKYYRRFPGIRKLKYATKRNMEGRGYVVTLFGRRHRETDGRFTYKAINSLVQGTSADLTKAAMVKVDRSLHENRMRSLILLMVHDEIIVEAPNEELEQALEIIRESMEEFDVFCVPLKVDIKSSNRWHSKGG